MKTTSITCDYCEKDIEEKRGSDFCLKLSSDKVYSNRNEGLLIIMSPLINRDHHFCSFQCLQDWIVI